MAKTFRCSIVTPAESVFDGEITYASIPAWDGQLGVMSGQSPMLTRLGIGSLRLDAAAGGKPKWYFVDSGFAQVQDEHLTLLTESAEPADALDAREAAAELAEANARVVQSPDDLERVVRDQQRAMARKTIATTHGRG